MLQNFDLLLKRIWWLKLTLTHVCQLVFVCSPPLHFLFFPSFRFLFLIRLLFFAYRCFPFALPLFLSYSSHLFILILSSTSPLIEHKKNLSCFRQLFLQSYDKEEERMPRTNISPLIKAQVKKRHFSSTNFYLLHIPRLKN